MGSPFFCWRLLALTLAPGTKARQRQIRQRLQSGNILLVKRSGPGKTLLLPALVPARWRFSPVLFLMRLQF
ncbi:hypothetical protein A5320_02355 [Rheinheimera sp. SA_1]|uniref:hypothetical protein n=1 Tax=Rheinheimera sp. SA_1 TaxID=1827365 RepID=UPI0008019397|nr:hypothetical protein [Rheinheimera sp. SA_1]OBP16272.1 hypothetical protein A5320_02355 [Rheinheimera sp. SA_1]